jgi:hypothetical protein
MSLFGEETAFEKFEHEVESIQDICHDDESNLPLLLVNLVHMIGNRNEYTNADLKKMFWMLADFHLPVHLLRIVLEKLELEPEEIPVSSYDNYLAVCVALICENLRSEHDEAYVEETKIYLADLLELFDWDAPYYIAAEEGDPESVREFIEWEASLSVLFK